MALPFSSVHTGSLAYVQVTLTFQFDQFYLKSDEKTDNSASLGLWIPET